MTVNELSAIQTAASYAMDQIGRETKSAANQIEQLFSGKFYNAGGASKKTIEAQIKSLQEYIEEKEKEYNKTYTYLKRTDAQLAQLNQQLKDEIYEVTKAADADERLQKKFIELTIDEVNNMYMNGEIEKEDMADEIAKKLTGYGMRGSALQKMDQLNFTKQRITILTEELSTLMDAANDIDAESRIAQGTLKMLQNLAGKMSVGRSDNRTAANEVPIYTPQKQALIDSVAQGVRGVRVMSGTQSGCTNDTYSMANSQMRELKKFLGLENEGNGKYGVKEGSVLAQMKDAGFTQKEALYAICWIFDKCNLSYTPGGNWKVPYGHWDNINGTSSREAATVYSELISQVNTLWGAGSERWDESGDPDVDGDDPFPPEPGPEPEPEPEPTPGPIPDPEPEPIPDPEPEPPVDPPIQRTDPIGYTYNDCTYEFVMDRNGNGKFDDKNEFLGAQNGISELQALDVNGDNIIDEEELKAENLFMLMTDHVTGEHRFMSANEAGITSIDLSTLTSKNWTNINNNVLKNTFTVNTVMGEMQGYQTDDSDRYIQKSYSGAMNNDMYVEVDEDVLEEAHNIFSQIKVAGEDTDELQERLAEAARDVRNTQVKVNRSQAEMREALEEATHALPTVERDDGHEEAEEVEEEEQNQPAFVPTGNLDNDAKVYATINGITEDEAKETLLEEYPDAYEVEEEEA